MLKLLIADDERIIREAISNIIDWAAYDIEIIGLCKNGIDAFNVILDESPDIVLTDIRMPGLSGLEIIERIYNSHLPIQFIILSGYGEFEYAKKAMRFGVKHFLLKPCNENQIIDSIICCINDYRNIRLSYQYKKEENMLHTNMLYNLMANIINEMICQDKSFESSVSKYEQYLNFYSTAYRLHYIYYLEDDCLNSFLSVLRSLRTKFLPDTVIYGCYVKYTLIIFYQDEPIHSSRFEEELDRLCQDDLYTKTEQRSLSYPALKNLIIENINKLRRFSSIYYIYDFCPIYICNYDSVIKQAENLCENIFSSHSEQIESLLDLFSKIENITFLKQLAASLLLKLSVSLSTPSPHKLTEWVSEIQAEESLERLKSSIILHFQEMFHSNTSENVLTLSTQMVCDYVTEHLQNSNLTLKYIAENRLFMNVDYVSRKFYKETGEKFSHYLTRIRIQKAKQILSENPDKSIQEVALAVGFGNNPRYFSQVFKKQEQLTPTEYIRHMHST